jgi:hypothetical protein
MSIQDELLLIKGDSELLTGEEVVKWARAHPDSELYNDPIFCGWDEKKSAYEHWLWGARRLIALHVVYEDGERKFVSLSVDRARDGGGYRDMDEVLRSKALHEVMLADALRELERMEAKYNRLLQLKPVWRAAARVRGAQRKGKGGGAGKAA